MNGSSAGDIEVIHVNNIDIGFYFLKLGECQHHVNLNIVLGLYNKYVNCISAVKLYLYALS